MKKSFLTLGILGALGAINGYADNKMVAVYTCQDGCNVTNDKTNFNCLYPDGKSCGNAAVDIFVSQTSGTMFAPNAQPKSESARSAVTARAAKKTTTKPTSGNNPTGPENAAGGGFEITCSSWCEVKCVTVGGNSVCGCVDKYTGEKCGEERVLINNYR